MKREDNDTRANSDSWGWPGRLAHYTLRGIGLLIFYLAAAYAVLEVLVQYLLGGMLLLLVHTAAILSLLTQPIGTGSWLAGGGYVVLLVLVLILVSGRQRRVGQIAVLYAIASGLGIALVIVSMFVPGMGEVVTASFSRSMLTAVVPALLVGVWWRQKRRDHTADLRTSNEPEQ